MGIKVTVDHKEMLYSKYIIQVSIDFYMIKYAAYLWFIAKSKKLF
jgi:hypothetical protein